MNNLPRGDLYFSYVSFGILAVAGLTINLAISHLMGAGALGIFNQQFAVYIVSSQLATLGIHFSVLRQTSILSAVTDRYSSLVAGLLTALFLSVCTAIVLYVISPFIGVILASESVGAGLPFVAMALVPFSLNKTILAYLNGLPRIKIFASIQAARYLLIVLFIFYFYRFGEPIEYFSKCFFFTELILLTIGLTMVWQPMKFIQLQKLVSLMKMHLTFGVKAAASGIFLEFNSRVDILILGAFSSDVTVGFYSFASTIAEGYYQLVVVLRNLINPKLAALFHTNSQDSIVALIRHNMKLTYFLMLICYFAGIFGVHLLNRIILKNESDSITLVYSILACGIFISSGFFAIETVFIQAGRPSLYSFYIILLTSINLLGNLILTPIFGLFGAAFATAFAFISGAIIINKLAKKYLSLDLWKNLLSVNRNSL